MDIKSILHYVKSHTPSILGHERFSNYAVLLPLIEKNNEVHILFEIRSKKMRRQPGEICFPGGRIDEQDTSSKDAAIRETTEELNIKSEQIIDVYPLNYLVSPYGMIVYPYVGKILEHESISPNHTEVEQYFTVPLSFFLKTKPSLHLVHARLEPEDGFPLHLIPGGKNYNWRARQIEEMFYQYEDKVIWGLTARILHHFLELISET
jgi:peroxisomal coenzyme A diphosphatase NUDT7